MSERHDRKVPIRVSKGTLRLHLGCGLRRSEAIVRATCFNIPEAVDDEAIIIIVSAQAAKTVTAGDIDVFDAQIFDLGTGTFNSAEQAEIIIWVARGIDCQISDDMAVTVKDTRKRYAIKIIAICINIRRDDSGGIWPTG